MNILKLFWAFIMMINLSIADNLIGNYIKTPKTAIPNTSIGFSITPENAFLLKPVTLNVKNAPIGQVLSYLSGISQVPIELKDNIQDKISFFGQGTLKSILDTLCAYNDLYYKIKDGKIIVRRYMSAIFQLNIPMTTTKAYNFSTTFGQSVTNSSSGGGIIGSTTTNPVQNNGTNTSSSNFSYNQNLTQNIVLLIQPLLQDPRSKISYDPNTGLLSFFGSVNDYKVVRSVVKQLNDRLSKPIKVRINIIALNLLNEYSTGINISALFQHLKNLQISLNAPMTATNSSNSIFTASINTTSYTGLIQALQQYGKTKSIDSETYTVLPNQPIVYAPTQTQSYISSYNIYIPPIYNNGVVSSPVYIPVVSYLNTGTSMTILPRLTSNNRLMVDVYYSQNTSQGFNTQNINISSGVTVPIQFPQISSQNSILTSVLKQRQTIALISSVYDLNKNNENGIPFLIRIPLIKYLFGNTDKYSNKVQFIITITYEGLGKQ